MPPDSSLGRVDNPRYRFLLALSPRIFAVQVLAAFLTVLVWFTGIPRGQEWAERARTAFGPRGRAWAHTLDPAVYGMVIVMGLVVIGGLLVATREGRGAPLFGASLVLVAGANTTTQVAKALLPLDAPPGQHLFPSGHSSMALSLCLAAVMCVPQRWRLVTGTASAFVCTAVGLGTVVGQWHRPSDVWGSWLCCALWSALSLALFPCAREGRSQREKPQRIVAAVAVGSIGGLLLMMFGVFPAHGSIDVRQALVSAGLIVGLLIWALSWFVVAVADRRD